MITKNEAELTEHSAYLGNLVYTLLQLHQHGASVMTDDRLISYGVFLLRVALGVMFMAHSVIYMLMTLSLAETAKFFVSIGLPAWMAYATFLAEAVGGILLILGIQTRWVALALSPILIGATWAHVGNGWVFTATNGGWEYPLYLFVLCIAQAMLGDGAFALAPSRLSGSGARKTMLEG